MRRRKWKENKIGSNRDRQSTDQMNVKVGEKKTGAKAKNNNSDRSQLLRRKTISAEEKFKERTKMLIECCRSKRSFACIFSMLASPLRKKNQKKKNTISWMIMCRLCRCEYFISFCLKMLLLLTRSILLFLFSSASMPATFFLDAFLICHFEFGDYKKIALFLLIQ